jgi:lysophospholipase L1-like esterase
MKENQNLVVTPLSEIANLKVHGRTTGELAPLTLFWTGSMLELNVSGTELWIEVEADYDMYEPWISIVVNGAFVSRSMLISGKYWICVFRGMNTEKVKNIRIVKEVQAMSGDSDCLLQLHAVKSDGEFLPIEEQPYKIEFVGDSLTSGEGLVGAVGDMDWISMYFGTVNNYAVLTALAMKAEYRIVSQSGWGVLTGWDNNPHSNIPEYYEKICGLVNGDRNIALGAHQDYDFSSWQPDFVIVNLGTNDTSAFYQPEWKDDTTGERHKQRCKEDGSFHEEDLKAFEAAITSFLVKLRRCNPKAHIVWAYGMAGIMMLPAIYRAFEEYRKNSNDTKVSIFQLPTTSDAEEEGSREHPGTLAHERTAKRLTDYLKSILEDVK